MQRKEWGRRDFGVLKRGRMKRRKGRTERESEERRRWEKGREIMCIQGDEEEKDRIKIGKG